MTSSPRRSPVPWLFALAGLLCVLSPFLFFGLWIGEGFVAALVAVVLDLVAAFAAAVTATVLATQRGITRVRTVVSGHPQGRAGRMAAFHAARWSIARERFVALQREYAAFEADPTAVAARPALTDVSVPSTARFVEAYADAEYLVTDAEPAGPRREEFAVAVDRAVDAWEAACRVADGLAGAARSEAEPTRGTRPTAPHAVPGHTPPQVEPTRATPPAGSEYHDAAEAVRRAAARGARDLRERLRG